MMSKTLFFFLVLVLSFSCAKEGFDKSNQTLENLARDNYPPIENVNAEDIDKTLLLPENYVLEPGHTFKSFLATLSKQEYDKLEKNYLIYEYLEDNDLFTNELWTDLNGGNLSDLNLEKYLSGKNLKHLQSKIEAPPKSGKLH